MARLKKRTPKMSILFLDRSADLAEMLTKSVIRIRCPFFQVIRKLQLFAKGPTDFDLIGLFAFRRPDVTRSFQNLFDRFQLNKDATVIIGKDDIVLSDFKIGKSRDT